MKKVKMIFLSSIFMSKNKLNAKSENPTIQQLSNINNSKERKSKTSNADETSSISSSKYPYGNHSSTKSYSNSNSSISFQTEPQSSTTNLNSDLKKSNIQKTSNTNNNKAKKSKTSNTDETSSISSSKFSSAKSYSGPNSTISFQTEPQSSAPSKTYSETSSCNESDNAGRTILPNSLASSNLHIIPRSVQSNTNSFKNDLNQSKFPITTLDLSKFSSQNLIKYAESQKETNNINILEYLNQSYEYNSNIYENFMFNFQKTKLYSMAKNLNINIEDQLKNISNETTKVNFQTELDIQEQILDKIFELIEQNLSNITNFTEIHSQLNESIKLLQETINTADKKDIITINLTNSIIDLLQNLKKNIEYFSSSIKTDLDKIHVCYKIDFFNILLSNTKDDLEEELLKEHIIEIWGNYRLKYFEKNPTHMDLLSKKSNKETSIKDFNNFPIDFQEDVNSIINYAKSTTEKMDAIVELIQPLSNLANLSDSLLGNFTSLEFLTKFETNFESMSNVIQKIKIDNTLPNITSSINNLYPILSDSLTLLLIETVTKAENIYNKNNAGFFKTFKRTFTPITLSGLASLKNILMFNHFKIHSNDFVDKYSLSAHDWYSSNYRIPNILNTMSTDNKNSIIKALELQKLIILKLIETFNHNYQNKNLLTKKDYKHIKKLISQLQIIMNILTSLKAPSETTSSSLKTLEDLKFNLHSVSEDLSYIKRNSYQPNELFFALKKAKESDSIQILTSETNNEQLRYLTKILYEFFNNGKKLTKVSEEDSKDLKDNNLFDLKINHNEFLNKK